MMYTLLPLALALFGTASVQAQGYTCPAGQTFFAGSDSASARCCPSVLPSGCTLSSDIGRISCQFAPGTSLSFTPGLTSRARLIVSGSKGQDATAATGGDADPDPSDDDEEETKRVAVDYKGRKRTLTKKRAKVVKPTKVWQGGNGGTVFANVDFRPAYTYQIEVGKGGDQVAGAQKGLKWGGGGSYSSFSSTKQGDKWSIVGAGGGGAGNAQPGIAASDVGAGQACKNGPQAVGGGVPTINPNGNTNRGGGGAGCPGGQAGQKAGTGGKAGTSARGPDTNFGFASAGLDAYITLDFSCEEVVFLETVASATVTNTAFTTIDTVYTAPPTSTVTENETPAVSTIKETTTATQTFPTAVVVETSTPPVVTVDETKTETAFSTVQTATTVTPDTVQSTFSTDTTITPATRTATSTITSTTGVANCVQIRMVYNPNCCPASYVAMSGRLRHRRRGLHGGALDKRILTGTLTDGTSTSSVTDDATATLEGETPISTLTETAATPLFTESFTDTSTLETPLMTTTTTLEAARETKTALETTTIVDATNVETIEAPTPTNIISSTSTHFAPTPVTTTTTTAFARSTSCAIQLGATQGTCPLPFLAGADHVVQIALLKAKKLFTGRPVIVDCGSAGQYLY